MTQHNYNDSIEACAAHYGDEAEAVKTYMQEGLKQALRLPNRGPIQFLKNGALHPEIREAYSKYGFYVFEGVVNVKSSGDNKFIAFSKTQEYKILQLNNLVNKLFYLTHYIH